MKVSQLLGERYKDRVADIESQNLMTRGGYMKQVGNGIYSLLPPATRIQRKIERILREESVKMMLAKQIVRGDGDHHGFAVHIRNFDGREIHGHTGYWPPYRASLFFDLQRGCGVISLLNTNKELIRDEIMQRVFEMNET